MDLSSRDCWGKGELHPWHQGRSATAEGVAAPLEPNPQLEENHHWKWFQEFGAKECPYAHQDWHKESPSLCRPCEYANKTARAYAAAVSKNLQEELAETKADMEAGKEAAALVIANYRREITALRETK